MLRALTSRFSTHAVPSLIHLIDSAVAPDMDLPPEQIMQAGIGIGRGGASALRQLSVGVLLASLLLGVRL